MALQSVEEICDIIKTIGSDFQLVEHENDLLKTTTADGSVIIAVPSADTSSEEGCLCTLKFSSGKMIQVKKAKEYDFTRLIKFNVSRDAQDVAECNVCMTDVQNLIECNYCNCNLCSKCIKKLTHNHVLKCPLCATYSLQNNTFGIPFADGAYISMPKYLTSAKAQMKRLLETLDGKIEMVYSIDGHFTDPVVLKLCRFPLTNKYCDRYMKLRDVLDTLSQVYETRCYKKNRLMNVYMFRQTYKIKDGKALTETSLYKWTSQKLIQYPINTWKDIFFEVPMRFKQKIEYLCPEAFVLPKHIIRMFQEIHRTYPGVKDGYIFGCNDTDYSLVFNVDEHGEVAREQQPIVARHMLELIDRNEAFHVMFCSIDDPLDIFTYRVSSRSSTRLTQRQNVHFCRRNNMIVGNPI